MDEHHFHHHFHYGECPLTERIERMECQMATLADEIARLQADDTELQSDVTAIQSALSDDAASIAALRAQIDAGGLSPEQQTALEQVASDLEASHSAIATSLPSAPAPSTPPVADVPSTGTPTPGPASFVAKLNGELYVDYQDRVNAWNADPTNAGNEVVALDEPSWTALPVS